MLNLNDIFVFVRVVDCGGFAAASRATGLPKSTLSKRLAELETALGVRLVQRTSRSFTVTEIGEEFYRHATAMLLEAEAAEQVIKRRLSEPSGAVRITASLLTSQRDLAGLLPLLATAYPKISVMLHATDRFVDIVQEGFDLAIRTHFAPLPDSGLVQSRIGFDPIWLVAAASYIHNRGLPAHPSDVSALDGLFMSPTDTTWTLGTDSGLIVETSPSPRYFANETVALREAAIAGLGVACLPGSICAPLIECGVLVRILPGWTAGGITKTLLMPHRRGQLPAVRVIADRLVDELRPRQERRERAPI